MAGDLFHGTQERKFVNMTLYEQQGSSRDAEVKMQSLKQPLEENPCNISPLDWFHVQNH